VFKAPIASLLLPAPESRENFDEVLGGPQDFSGISRGSPCNFLKSPCFPEFLQGGDSFAADCVLHHAVRCQPAVPGLRHIAPQFAGILAGSMVGLPSPLPLNAGTAQILAHGLWGPQTRSWRRPVSDIAKREGRVEHISFGVTLRSSKRNL
jgi:hypothetical protein